MAVQAQRPLGALVSDLLRKALAADVVASAALVHDQPVPASAEYAAAALGLVPFLAADHSPVTSAEVNALRDREGI